MSDAAAGEAQRLDKWLWFARFCKTRTLAQALCGSGHVRRNGETVLKAAALVRPGDELTLVLGSVRRRVVVRAPGVRRGPAPEAQTLYDEPDPPQRLVDPVLEAPAVRLPGSGRPTKKDRRALDRLRDEGPWD
ncbi:RNA-binding S4 domain-containing protein [Pararhodospirillum photometricum]|uniref:RNA-binding S4 n=1 Tax=Pararhodospirillum photometricum DSM 122 TaxID=1150469 RepID=H6SPW3_PARPM|nr:RNA-binding S4 domain-containing protein [Pararhodospirillum photometricum]CCG07233.1 RNA-binding S4 [Pararhodospirillum photometricum DSM 122]